MVKKLLKYEFSALAKTLLPMEIVLLSIALFNRFVQIFENDGTTYTIFIYSSSILLGIAMLVCLIFTVAICIVRFYKNLYTSQGYLTLTLPVTHSEHLWAKLISSVAAIAAAFISVIAALAVSTAGDVFGEICKAVIYLAKQYFRITKGNGGFYLIELLVLFILATAGEMLLFYTCMTVGQLAKKNRVLLSFGIYFAVYVFWQILSTIVIIIASVLSSTGFLENIYIWVSKHFFTFLHLIFCGGSVLTFIFCFICFLITKNIMKNKLNLE